MSVCTPRIHTCTHTFIPQQSHSLTGSRCTGIINKSKSPKFPVSFLAFSSSGANCFAFFFCTFFSAALEFSKLSMYVLRELDKR